MAKRVANKVELTRLLPWAVTRHESGATLIELMIALAIGLVLLFGLSQIYLAGKQTYRLTDAQSRLMENGRYALEALSYDIRLAGQQGCRRDAPITVIAGAQPRALLVPDTAVETAPGAIKTPIVSGEDDVSVSAIPLINSPLPGADTLTLISGLNCGGVLTSRLSTSDPRGRLQPEHNCNFDTGTPLLVTSCKSAHLFRVGASDQDVSQNITQTGIATNRLGAVYLPGAEIMLLQARSYYLRLNPAGQPALYRVDHVAATVAELVEGVEDMQLRYGLDSNGDGSSDQLVEADAVSSWAQVVSVQINLMLRSVEDRVLANSRTYTMNSNTLSDQRLAHQFALSVAIRNRTQ